MSERFSRGELISLIAGIPAAVALTTDAASAAPTMDPKSPAVMYQPTPHGKQQCATCTLFVKPGSCKVVKGAISPKGWCKLYSAPAKS